jgi:hypothetical protein
MKNLLIATVVCLTLGIGKIYTQPTSTFIYPTLEEKVEKSDVIIEGQVINTRGFENVEKTSIYTSATIRISKIFKGSIVDSTIEIVFEGGKLGDKRQILTHAFYIDKGRDGVFFLKANTSSAVLGDKSNSYILPMGTSSYIEYHHDPVNHPATSPGSSYNDIEKDLFQRIEAITKVPRIIVSASIFDRKAATSKSKQ